MNGVHDLGGVDGFGPVEVEPNEPVFHAEWERRVFGLAALMIPQFSPPRARSGTPSSAWTPCTTWGRRTTSTG